MTKVFEEMIYLFSCGAMGISPKAMHDLDIQAIYQEAAAQGITHTVFLALSELYDNGMIHDEAYNNFKYHTIVSVSDNIKRLWVVRNLLDSFQENKIKYAVLKGEALSYLYKNPDCRISADADIFIGNDQTDKAVTIMENNGFTVAHRNSKSNHLILKHPIAGVVELHTHLYNRLVENVWFDNTNMIWEDYITIKTYDGFELSTFGITDGLIITALHYIKHFLSGGAGMRPLMDILLYMKEYRKEIDWERYYDVIGQLKYRKFMDQSIGIGVKYMNFSKDSFPPFVSDDSMMDKIASDIENGGAFGLKQEERETFRNIYNEALTYKKRKNTEKPYLIMFRLAFPDIDAISIKYTYVKKAPFLYPLAWLCRTSRFLMGIFKRKKSIQKIAKRVTSYKKSDIIKERMELIRELEMI